jgi:mono/diheme cytochrome c family protein
MDGMKGPSWLGLAGAEVPLAKGGKVQADRAYLKESILTPTAKVRKGFDAADGGMPPYAGILSEGQIESILLFIESLKRPAGR